MTHGWNTPSICSYLCVSNAALVSGDVSFGSRYEIKYRRTWWWVKKLDEMMTEPIFVFCRITWNWWCWLPPGSDVTPKYLNFLVDFNWCIVRLIVLLEEGICIVFSVVCLLMYGEAHCLQIPKWLYTMHTLWVQELRQKCGVFVPNYLLLFASYRISLFLSFLSNRRCIVVCHLLIL